MFNLLKSIFTRTNILTAFVVCLLFAVLPISQKLAVINEDAEFIVREVDVVPPPPPPPPRQSQNSESSGGSQGGIDLESIPNSVRLLPVSFNSDLGNVGSGEFGLAGFELGLSSSVTFSMEGVGFGGEGLDRPPILLVRPTLNSDYMERIGIDQFQADVMVKWLEDGTLILVGIERIDFPDEELEKMVREAVPRMRYSRPTVDGQPTERFIRLTLTIHAN